MEPSDTRIAPGTHDTPGGEDNPGDRLTGGRPRGGGLSMGTVDNEALTAGSPAPAGLAYKSARGR